MPQHFKTFTPLEIAVAHMETATSGAFSPTGLDRQSVEASYLKRQRETLS
jgi:hypothetical protein